MPHRPAGLISLLKAASRELVLACGPQKVAAALLGLSEGQLSKAIADHHPDILLSLADIAALEMHVQKPVLARALAGLTGHRLEAADQPAPGGLVVDLVAIGKEAGDVLATLGEALADGDVSPREAKNTMHEIEQLEDVLGAAKRKLASAVAPRLVTGG